MGEPTPGVPSLPAEPLATPMAASVSVTAPIPPTSTSVPFFQTAVGRAVVKILLTGVISIIGSLVNDPAVASWALGIGGMNIVLSLARDVADSSIPNIP